MTKVLFVCHGNICRSPMAQYVFKKLAEEAGVGHLFDNYAAAFTKVYYAPNMIGQFTKCINVTTLTISDLINAQIWAEENSARTNPTNFAIKPAAQNQEETK